MSPDGPRPVVSVRGLRVDGLIDGLGFDLGAGECLAILDEHDVRRSALLQCLAGVRRPDGGTVTAPAAAAVWHDDGLPDDRPVQETVDAVVLERLGLTHRAGHEPWAMSAGERRRIATEAALMAAAPLKILDEPERGLDKSAMRWLAGRITEVRDSGATIVLATHSRWLAEQVGDLVVDEFGG